KLVLASGFAGAIVFLLLLSHTAGAPGAVGCLAGGLACFGLAASTVLVNSLDLAPRHARVLGGLQCTPGNVAGLIPPPLAGPRLHAELQPLQSLRHPVGGFPLAIGLGPDDPLLVLEDAEVLSTRLDGEPAREEEVARVARLDAHHVADLAQVRHVVAENDL